MDIELFTSTHLHATVFHTHIHYLHYNVGSTIIENFKYLVT